MKRKHIALLIVGALVFTWLGAFIYDATLPQYKKQTELQPAISTVEVWKLVNDERSKSGLQPLALDERLNKSATDKCNDMVTRNYWAHNAPDGTEPWGFITKYVDKTGYSGAGENLAQGYHTNKDLVAGWMDSPTHKQNILEASYINVGYGVCSRPGEIVVVQHFLAK